MHYDGPNPTLSSDPRRAPAVVRSVSLGRGPHLRGACRSDFVSTRNCQRRLWKAGGRRCWQLRFRSFSISSINTWALEAAEAIRDCGEKSQVWCSICFLRGQHCRQLIHLMKERWQHRVGGDGVRRWVWGLGDEEGGIGGSKGVYVARGVRVAVVEADIRRWVWLLAAHNCSIRTITFDVWRRLGSSTTISGAATSIRGGGRFGGGAWHLIRVKQQKSIITNELKPERDDGDSDREGQKCSHGERDDGENECRNGDRGDGQESSNEETTRRERR